MTKGNKTEKKKNTHEQRVLFSIHKTFRRLIAGDKVSKEYVRSQLLRVERRLDKIDYESRIRYRKRVKRAKRNVERAQLR